MTMTYDRKKLKEQLEACREEFEKVKMTNLELNLSRGKPSKEQLNLSMKLLDEVNSRSDCFSEDGMDCRNYGALDGIPEAKRLMAEMLGTDPANVMVFGNSSLDLMFQTLVHAMIDGLSGCKPMLQQTDRKFLCPVPGYDRHFAITERLGFKLIPIPMNEDGPDMKLVRKYVEKDETVKGIWCVPKFQNPTGIIFSDEVVHAFSKLTPAAPDFRIYWDNAYGIHHLYEDTEDHVLEILKECKKAGNPDIVYKFSSTSKICFPGSGIAAIAASHNNLEDIRKQLTIQTIGHDKVNQLRHVRFFKDLEGMKAHMKKHADILRPKFETVEEILDRELEGLEIARWTKPKGGYFISFNGMNGTAKRIVEMCQKAGVKLTKAGAAFPYGKDPEDSHIRIAPSYPTPAELTIAAELFALSAKIVSIDKILEERAAE